MALDIARRFFNTVYQGWVNTNYIFEKYHADELGVYGGGGEYVVQEGFGWTNGVVIKFIEWFGDELKCDSTVGFQVGPSSSNEMAALSTIVENANEQELATNEATTDISAATAAAEPPIPLVHSQSNESSSESVESVVDRQQENINNANAVPSDQTDEAKPDEISSASSLPPSVMSSVFGTEEQVRRRMSELISEEISNEISISIQQMEI